LYLPRRTSNEKRLETALNLNIIPKVDFDIGFSYPLPINVVLDDSGKDEYTQIGPKWYHEMGWRGAIPTMGGEIQVGRQPGDIWYAYKSLGAGFGFRIDKLPDFGIGISANIEFGSGVDYVNGIDNFKIGNVYNFGVSPSYNFPNVGRVRFGANLRIKQNDSFGGEMLDNTGAPMFPEVAMVIANYSFNHNGTMDLRLDASFERQLLPGLRFSIAVNTNIPVGGDRYKWSSNDPDELGLQIPSDIIYFRDEVTERYKKASTWLSIPISININL